MHLLKKLTLISALLLSCLSNFAFGQEKEDKDSLVVLLSSKSAQMVDLEGARYRKVVGPARFLHNNTYLICDTALWNVETQVIDAWGKVSILQDETVLTSDNLTYLIDQDLAQFRMELLFFEKSVTAHEGYGTYQTVFHPFPVIHNYFTAFGQTIIFILKVRKVETGLTGVQPIRKHNRDSRDRYSNNNITFQRCFFGIVCGNNFHIQFCRHFFCKAC